MMGWREGWRAREGEKGGQKGASMWTKQSPAHSRSMEYLLDECPVLLPSTGPAGQARGQGEGLNHPTPPSHFLNNKYRSETVQFRLGLEPMVFLKLNVTNSIFGCTGSSLLLGLFSSCGEQGCPLAAMLRLLTGRLLCRGAQSPGRGLSSCGPRTWLPSGTWDLPGPMSRALAGRFLTAGPPGKSLNLPVGSNLRDRCSAS